MTAQTEAKNNLQDSLKKLLSPKDPLSALRKKAWDFFEERGLPTVKDEDFQYLKLGALFSRSLKPVAARYPKEGLIEEALASYKGQEVLVFYNGQFVPRYSQLDALEDELVILPFSEAYLTYGTFFRNYFDQWMKKEKDPFALLALALNQEGLFVYVPKNTHCEKELIVLEVSDVESESLLAPMSLFSFGQNSSLKVSTSTYCDHNPKLLVSSYQGFILDQHANVKHAHCTQKSQNLRFESVRVQQQKETEFRHVQASLDPFKVRVSYHVELLGEHAHSEILSLNALKKQQEAHIHILMEHKAPNCYSRQLVKNLLDDKAQASFEGKIKVDSIAQQTNAYQLNQNCVLSDEANVYSKPNLEIFADDVKASHGSTTGQVDLDQLFYLQSRGLSSFEAKKILLKGFCDEIRESMHSTILQQQLSEKIEEYFNQA